MKNTPYYIFIKKIFLTSLMVGSMASGFLVIASIYNFLTSKPDNRASITYLLMVIIALGLIIILLVVLISLIFSSIAYLYLVKFKKKDPSKVAEKISQGIISGLDGI